MLNFYYNNSIEMGFKNYCNYHYSPLREAYDKDPSILDPEVTEITNLSANGKRVYESSEFNEFQSNNTKKLNSKMKRQLIEYHGHLEYEFILHSLLNELNINHKSGNQKKVISPSKYDKSFKRMSRYYLDFYIPELNLCIECDGSFHTHLKASDKIRDDFLLNKLGIKTIRLSNEIISNLTKYDLLNIIHSGKIPVELLETPKALVLQ